MFLVPIPRQRLRPVSLMIRTLKVAISVVSTQLSLHRPGHADHQLRAGGGQLHRGVAGGDDQAQQAGLLQHYLIRRLLLPHSHRRRHPIGSAEPDRHGDLNNAQRLMNAVGHVVLPLRVRRTHLPLS